jgi:ABC-type methionine transport system ATPase subunit
VGVSSIFSGADGAAAPAVARRAVAGHRPKLVQDIARSIVAINRDEKVSVLLVEQNSRMALRISQRAYALTTGKVALSGNSAEMLTDERVRHLYLGGEVFMQKVRGAVAVTGKRDRIAEKAVMVRLKSPFEMGADDRHAPANSLA